MLALIRSISSICQKSGTAVVIPQFKEKIKTNVKSADKISAPIMSTSRFKQTTYMQITDEPYKTYCYKDWCFEVHHWKGLTLQVLAISSCTHNLFTVEGEREIRRRWNPKLLRTKNIQRYKIRPFPYLNSGPAGLPPEGTWNKYKQTCQSFEHFIPTFNLPFNFSK